MKQSLILAFLFISTGLYAKSITVDWICAKETPEKIAVEIYFDDIGGLVFKPDISSESHDSDCTKNFQRTTGYRLADFKRANCPSSQDNLCFASSTYINSVIEEKFKDSPKPLSGLFSFLKSIGPAATSTSTPESYLAEKVAKKEIDLKNLQQTFRFKDQTYKVSDFDKVIGDNLENIFFNMKNDEAKQYMQNYLVAKSDVLGTQQPSPKRTDVLNNLKSMTGAVYGDKGPQELAKMLECAPEDRLKPLTDVVKKLEESQEVSNCDKLNPGQYKVSKVDHKNYATSGNYLLKRKPDGNYQAILNVDFSKGTGSVSPVEMLERSKKCLALASPYMKGPDGTKIEIVPMAPWEIAKLPNGERPEVNDISIESPGFGTHSKAYAENVDCPTITHEILHLLGLCDEYKESRPQYSYGCRVVTKAPSIMRELDTFNKVVPLASNCDCSKSLCSGVMNSRNEDIKKLYLSEDFSDIATYKFRGNYCKWEFLPASKNLPEPSKGVVLLSDTDRSFAVESRYINSDSTPPNFRIARMKLSCSCPEDNNDCLSEKKKIMEKIARPTVKNSCPSGAPLIKSEPGSGAGEAKFVQDTLTLTSVPEIPSFLQPNHFHKILEGNCPQKSQNYRQCGDFAYKKEPCSVPQNCYDDKFYLGSEQ